ncbi:MAG: hypothetical protein EPN58_11425 [Rhodanobacter sp.]|nr:MAG: hypothetical protein EPN58_11425 [Rhodanobacter sp.]
MKALLALVLFAISPLAVAGTAQSSFGVSLRVVHRCSVQSTPDGAHTTCASKYAPPHVAKAPQVVAGPAAKRYEMVDGERLAVVVF